MKQRWINRPFVKGFLGGIVTTAACSLSMPFSERFEPSIDASASSFFLEVLVYAGIPLGILLAVGWLANKALSHFDFEGFRISEEFQAKGFLGYVVGGFVYFIASMMTLLLIRILTRAF
ncbi:hypothetical protein [Candidatus Leptofilum sp.]|uniref:hypothetical protein n=1 Tax=Candidatus Leptofilum sp. TaxID=3241576 RepID=UPI003B5C41EE